jgi:hypothetical protein
MAASEPACFSLAKATPFASEPETTFRFGLLKWPTAISAQ